MVFTQFNITHAKNSYPMRCVQSRQFGYIFNAWADGERLYIAESKTGLTYKAMKDAEADPYIASRVKFYDYRCKEEFYDFLKDPDALNNLIDDRAYMVQINEYRNLLRQYLMDSGDPQMESFEKFIRQC